MQSTKPTVFIPSRSIPRRSHLTTPLAWRLNMLDARIIAWWARHGITLLRIALGLVFFWFGFLKFFPGASPAQDLAGRTISVLTFGLLPPSISLPALAVWESLIGLGLISGRSLRATLMLLFLQMIGTFLPLVFFPHESFKVFPVAPTLEGQYIIKNLVLVAAAMVVGATARGGRLIYDPQAAQTALHTQTLHERFRRRFGREP